MCKIRFAVCPRILVASLYEISKLRDSRHVLQFGTKAVILPPILYGCVTWYLTVREGHSLKMFENRAPPKIFGLSWKAAGKNCKMCWSIFYTSRKILSGRWNQIIINGRRMYTWRWFINLKKIHNLHDLRREGRIMFDLFSNKCVARLWTTFICHSIRTSG